MIKDEISASEADKLRCVLENCKSPVIMAHVSPDGDAVGSSLAMLGVFVSLGKKAYVILPDSVPQNLMSLDRASEIRVYNENREENNALISASDLIICLDFNASKRVDYMRESLLSSKAFKVMIDHHLEPEGFCDIVISRPSLSSTSMLLYKLLLQIGFDNKIDVGMASAIYAGMMTDTGNFSYNSNDPEIYFLISMLIEKGIDKDGIYTRVCNTSTEDKLRLSAYAISEKMEVMERYPVAIITLTRKELNHYSYCKGDTEGLVNEPLVIGDVFVSVFFREETGLIKVSLRSKGDFPVNIIASEQFGGGGHKNAAGGEFYGTINEAVEHFKKIIPLYVKPQF